MMVASGAAASVSVSCRKTPQGGSVRDFEVLEHTADVGFEAYGATREEVFRNAGRALMSVIVDLDSVEPRERLPVAAEGREPAGLLVTWLSEIVYLYDTEGWLFRDFEVAAVGAGSEATSSAGLITGLTTNFRKDSPGCSVAAIGIGERFEPGRHQINLLVKAITYHQLALDQIDEGHWRARVYVDI